MIARDYRNRRIGDFLKELNLTEGKATGFPIIRAEMAKNGSPVPVFYTDDERTLFLVTLPCHPEFTRKGTKSLTKSMTKLSREEIDSILTDQFDIQSVAKILDSDVSEVVDYVRYYIGTKSGTKSITLIDLLSTGDKSRSELLEGIELYNKTDNFNRYVKPLIDFGIIEMTLPDKPNSRFQKYRLTGKGRKLLKQSR